MKECHQSCKTQISCTAYHFHGLASGIFHLHTSTNVLRFANQHWNCRKEDHLFFSCLWWFFAFCFSWLLALVFLVVLSRNSRVPKTVMNARTCFLEMKVHRWHCRFAVRRSIRKKNYPLHLPRLTYLANRMSRSLCHQLLC